MKNRSRLLFLLAGIFVSSGCGSSSSDPGEGTSTEDISLQEVQEDEDAEEVDDLQSDTQEETVGEDDVKDVSQEETSLLPPLEDKGPQPLSESEWTWQIHDDDKSTGPHSYQKTPSAYYERARFEFDKPVRIRSLKVMVEVKTAGLLTAYVWDDWGGDFISLWKQEPLAVLKKQVGPADSGTWIKLPIVPTLELDPGRMVYAGLIVNGKDGIRLMSDTGQEEVDGIPGKSIVWLSNDVDQEFGGNTVYSLAKGDFMVRLETQDFDVVAEEDRLFEAMDQEALGIPSINRGGFADYDNDGDIDIMVSGRGLYSNNGDGTFSNVTDQALPPGFSCNGGVWGDFDNDGDPDWFGTGKKDVLLRNDEGVFSDVTAEAGIDDTQLFVCEGEEGPMNVPTESAAWIDVDGDGFLDLYQGNFICWTEGVPSMDLLWHNNGDGSFTNVSNESGITGGQFGGQASRGMAPADYNNDGHMDLLVTNYRLHRNMHWKNNGDGTMTNVGKESKLEGVVNPTGVMFAYGHSIGAAWGDFDMDGNLDVFIANLAHPRFFTFSDKQTLYLNNGGANPTFSDLTKSVGIRYQETPSNPNAWDFDNDGDLDLTWTCVYAKRPSQFYRNDWSDGAVKWKEVTHPSGMAVFGGWGSIVGDFDNDGDLDYFANSAFRNRNRFGRRAIQIRPRGSGAGATNKSGYGARVTVTANGQSWMQEHGGTHGTSTQDSPWLHFGVKKAETADVEVSFPLTGTKHTFKNLLAGRYTVHEDGTLEENP